MRFRRVTTITLGVTIALTTTGLLALASPAMAASGTTPDGFAYTTTGVSTATIDGYTPGPLAITIPSTIVDGSTTYTVTEIGANAFDGKGLTSVTIPNSVTTIKIEAFASNALTTVTIPDSVTFISNEAFGNNQLNSVTFGSSLVTIGDYAFDNNLLTTVTIPSSVTTIGNQAFYDNPITSVVFNGNSPSTMGSSAFGSSGPAVDVFYFDGATGFTGSWPPSVTPDYPTYAVSDASSTLILTPSGSVLADGSSSFTATVTVVGGSPSGPVAGFPAAFTVPSGVSASATSCLTDATGTCSITLTSMTPGTYTIGVLAGPPPGNLTADATFDPVPALAATGADVGPVPYIAGGALLSLGIILTVFAVRLRKMV